MNRLLNVAQLLNTCGAIEGRKKLQKIVHLLSEHGFRQDFSHRFGYLHYGPYSSELRDDLDALVGSDEPLVRESEKAKGDYTTYLYEASGSLTSLLSEIGADNEPEWAGLAKSLNRREAQDLEALSTIVYLRRLGHSGSDLRKKFTDLKPSLAEKADAAIQESDEYVQTP